MTDPIKALIEAAKRAVNAYNGNTSHHEERVAVDALAVAIAAAEARPEPAPDEAGDFYAQLPKGPTHGRFSTSDRADLDNLKRKAFEKARPEPDPRGVTKLREPLPGRAEIAIRVGANTMSGSCLIADIAKDVAELAGVMMRRHGEARPEPKPDSAARDWPEDFADENGNYSVLCSICQQWFLGYKRRVACKVCATKEARPDPAAEPIIIPALRKVAIINCDGDTSRALDLLCDAVEALAREVRR